MLDLSTPLGRLEMAALDLAASRPWADITLVDIADAAGLALHEVRAVCASKSELLRRLLRTVDDAVLKAAPRAAPDQGKRDLLFDVIMARLDLLAPYKSALASIYASGAADASLAGPYLASQNWMLQAAGIGTEGLAGRTRIAGLALAYADIFRTWLKDDDPGLAKTMATVDRHLRRGESLLKGMEDAGGALNRVASALRAAGRAAADAGRAARQASARTAASDEPKPAQPPT